MAQRHAKKGEFKLIDALAGQKDKDEKKAPERPPGGFSRMKVYPAETDSSEKKEDKQKVLKAGVAESGTADRKTLESLKMEQKQRQKDSGSKPASEPDHSSENNAPKGSYTRQLPAPPDLSSKSDSAEEWLDKMRKRR